MSSDAEGIVRRMRRDAGAGGAPRAPEAGWYPPGKRAVGCRAGRRAPGRWPPR